MKLIEIIIIIIMLGAVIFAGVYYYQRNVQECTSNPLVFSAKLYETNYNVEAIGQLTLLPAIKGQQPKIIIFNSTAFTVK